MEPKGFMGYLERGMHVNWVVLGMNNTPLIVWTKIIESMVFIDYPNEGIVFLLGFGIDMQYPSMFQ